MSTAPPTTGSGAGAALFEYRPARFGPMTVALFFILAIATPLAAADRAFAGRADEAALALVPLALVALFGWLTAPSPLRVSNAWIEVSLSRAARMRGGKARYAWSEVTNIYPTFYEDAGMRFSPFAAAEGTAKHAGIRIEAEGGERLVVPFTPTVLDLRHHGTPPYHAALDAIERACAAAGRPLVKAPPNLTDAEVEAMLIESSRPLLAFPLTVAGIFAPALLIPALAVALTAAAGPLPPLGTLAVVVVGLVPLISVFALVNLRSGRRTELLHQVQKHRHAKRERGAPPPPTNPPESGAANRPPPDPPQRVLRRRTG